MLTKTHATFFIIGFMLYVLLMIVVGIICSKGKSKGKDYLTGGGKMPMYLCHHGRHPYRYRLVHRRNGQRV